jgi:hypothetical protein
MLRGSILFLPRISLFFVCVVDAFVYGAIFEEVIWEIIEKQSLEKSTIQEPEKAFVNRVLILTS